MIPPIDDELVFYTHPMSRGRIVRWMLEEIGRPYRTVLLDFGTTMKAPDYLAINPMGKVPAVTWRGVAVTECAAICAWLADAVPEAGLAPALDEPARGTWLRWLFFAAGPLEAAVTARALNLLAPADKAGMAGYGSFEQVVDTLERAVTEGPWILGDRFSAADVYVGSQVVQPSSPMRRACRTARRRSGRAGWTTPCSRRRRTAEVGNQPWAGRSPPSALAFWTCGRRSPPAAMMRSIRAFSARKAARSEPDRTVPSVVRTPAGLIR